MAKSPDAFRTISEVADWLGVEAHVLRFWETKFAQVKPVKRAGGRRYYRPSDMALLGGIRRLLHEDGMTIRGVQKILREQGVAHVAGLSPEIMHDGVTLSAPRAARRATSGAPPAAAEEGAAARRQPPPAPDAAPTLPFDLPHAPPPGAEHAPEPGEVAVEPAEIQDGADARPSATALLRRHPAKLDPATAAPILARARRLAQRLRGAPER